MGTSPPRAAAPSVRIAALGVMVASIFSGIVPYFSRGLTDQGLAPQAVAFYRYVITALVLLPVLRRHLTSWRELLWGIAAGATMGLGWIGYAAGVGVAPASTIGVLYMTYPVFTILIARALFSDKITRPALVAAALVFLAAFVAGNPKAVPPHQMPALILSLAAPLGFGFGISVLVHRLACLPALARIAALTLGASLALAPVVIVTRSEATIPQNGTVWLLVAGLAIGTALIPQMIYTICSPIIGTARTAVYGSLELPTMFAVGIFAFGERLTLSQAVACVLILAAILLAQSRATRNLSTTLTRS